jgi:hypothetical protein
MDHQELKILMTWNYTLAYHHSHVGGRGDIDNLTCIDKPKNLGAGLYSGGPLERTFLENYQYVSEFLNRILPKLPT